MLVEFPREKFPKDMELEVGMPLMMNNGADQQFQVVVTEIKEEVVILDANHPLAGQDLVFDIELVEIEGSKPLIIMP